MPNVHITERPLWSELRNRRAHLGGTVPADRVLEVFGIVSPPVDVEGIAKALGFKVEHASMRPLIGEVDLTQAPAVIRVEREMIPQRQRFTIAHELGHALRHEPGVHHRDETFNEANHPPDRRRAEREANAFAADLLMPRWMLGPRTEGRFSIHTLSEIFNVSIEAMEYRLRNMLVIP